MKKRTMIFITAMVLLFAIVTGSTIAYMTSSTDPVVNTFTYGSVVIALDEGKVDTSTGKHIDAGATRTAANSYRLYPGSVYDKDPTIYVGNAKGSIDSEDCYLFVKVVNPIKALEASGNTTIAKQMEALGWVELDATNGIYYYDGVKQGKNDTTKTVSNGETIKVFNTVTIANNANLNSISSGAQVKIKAYAIQAENFNTALEAWNAAPLNNWGI
jgi:hypothetical protein